MEVAERTAEVAEGLDVLGSALGSRGFWQISLLTQRALWSAGHCVESLAAFVFQDLLEYI